MWEQEQAKKTWENTVPTLNEFLVRLLTLETALIGGGFLLLKGEVMSREWAIITLIALLVSLTAAVGGLMPIYGSFHPYHGDVDDHSRFENRVIFRKSQCMKVSAATLVLSLLVAIAGAAFSPPVNYSPGSAPKADNGK